MEKWSRRKKVSAVLIIGFVVMLLMGNIIQYSQNANLKEQMREQQQRYQSKYSKVLQEKEDLEQTLKKVESDLEMEKVLHRIVQEDYQKIATWTFEEAERKALEEGFDPAGMDWFLGNNGHWCFFYNSAVEEMSE